MLYKIAENPICKSKMKNLMIGGAPIKYKEEIDEKTIMIFIEEEDWEMKKVKQNNLDEIKKMIKKKKRMN